MTYGELYDRLNAIWEAEQEVTAAEASLRYGGSAETVRDKTETLADRRRIVAELRAEEMP